MKDTYRIIVLLFLFEILVSQPEYGSHWYAIFLLVVGLVANLFTDYKVKK